MNDKPHKTIVMVLCGFLCLINIYFFDALYYTIYWVIFTINISKTGDNGEIA